MKYCSHCGNQLLDAAIVCPHCGCAVVPMGRGVAATEPDIPSTGLNILAFLFPLIGLILYLTEKDKTPIKANAIGKWALISVIVSVALSILFTILWVVFIGVMAFTFG